MTTVNPQEEVSLFNTATWSMKAKVAATVIAVAAVVALVALAVLCFVAPYIGIPILSAIAAGTLYGGANTLFIAGSLALALALATAVTAILLASRKAPTKSEPLIPPEPPPSVLTNDQKNIYLATLERSFSNSLYEEWKASDFTFEGNLLKFNLSKLEEGAEVKEQISINIEPGSTTQALVRLVRSEIEKNTGDKQTAQCQRLNDYFADLEFSKGWHAGNFSFSDQTSLTFTLKNKSPTSEMFNITVDISNCKNEDRIKNHTTEEIYNALRGLSLFTSGFSPEELDKHEELNKRFQ